MFTSVPITQYVMSNSQQKITRHSNRQGKMQFEETKQTSDQTPDITDFRIIRTGI